MALGPNWVVKGDAEKTVKNFAKGMAEHLGYRWFKKHTDSQFVAWLEREMPLKGFGSLDDATNTIVYMREHASELYQLALDEANSWNNNPQR